MLVQGRFSVEEFGARFGYGTTRAQTRSSVSLDVTQRNYGILDSAGLLLR